MVLAVTPRREGARGACPPRGARSSSGQRLAATVQRSFRASARYANSTLRPLQCWLKPGAWDQLTDSSDEPWHAYWVFEAARWPVSTDTGLLAGDHTFAIQRADGTGRVLIPRNSSCYTGRISEDDGMYKLFSGRVSETLRGWCSAQNRAGRAALGLHLVYVTHAEKSVPSCEDGLWNGAESGTDCGAPCKGKPCALGEGCSNAEDCPSGVGCDSAQVFEPTWGDDGTVALGGLGSCALTCGQHAARGGCEEGSTVGDARYASLYCAVDNQRKLPCNGSTWATAASAGVSQPCCSTTSPCASFAGCTAATQYPDPNLDSRCSNVACSGAGDRAKCCLNRAPCSSAFSSSACATADANSVYNPSAYCATGTCDATKDKSACCPARALCSATFTPAVCKATDPNGVLDAGLVYTVSGTARCSGSACSTSSDWAGCCAVRADCATGFFGAGGRTCPAGFQRATGAPNCAARECTASDSATCCTKVVSRTCQAYSDSIADPNNPACTPSYGSLIASPSGVSCFSGFNCQVLCCTAVGTIISCDTLRSTTPTYCGADASSFLSPPLYTQCSLTVSGSCDEACCKKTV